MKKQFDFMCRVISCVILVMITLISCSKDELSDSSIVGTWSCSDRYYGGTDTYIFKKNGSYSWFYKGTADWFKDQNGTYTYNGTILTTKKASGTITVMYVVIGITKSSLVIMDDEGDKYTYYRKGK